MSNSNQWRVRQPRQGEAAGIEVYAGIKYVCQMSRHPGEQDMAETNARRIVACVNAMAGIQDDNILFAQDGSVRAALAELKQQRDQLLAALEVAREALDDASGNINPERGFADELEADVSSALDTVTAAIAAAKGGAV